jgi:hypothetical protein
MQHISTRACFAFVAGLAVASPVLGQDLFRLTLSEVGNASNSEALGGSSIPSLIEQALNTDTSQLARFENLSTNLSIDYAGLANAISINKDAGNQSATLNFNLPGATATRTFTGADQADLERQIRDYLLGEGQQDLTNFIRAVNAQSLIGVSDGNPNATTARLGSMTYGALGMRSDDAVSQGPLRLEITGLNTEVGDFDGKSLQGAFSFRLINLGRVGIAAGLMGAYNDVGDAEIFHAGAFVGVPIQIMTQGDRAGMFWQVTPHASVGASGSEDVANGGLVTGLGATNIISYDFTDSFTLAMTNQIQFFDGQEVEFQDVSIDPGVSQTMLKNGLRASLRLAAGLRVYAGASYTNYLDDARVEEWVSPDVGLLWTTGAGSSVGLGYTGDIGDDWTAHGLRATATLKF